MVPEMYNRDGFHLMATILHPYTRGTVQLASTNPFDMALIDPNFYADDRDITSMVDGR